jgi:hypothetical protein
MPDEMFFTDDAKSLRRGRRVTSRTPTCRPCVLWPLDEPALRQEGVVMDVNPYGCRIRSLLAFPVGSRVGIQIMRDDEFVQPLSAVQEGEVVRTQQALPGFTDHGIRLIQKEITKVETRPVERQPRPSAPRQPTRMHTRDLRGPNRRSGR